jgi:hypothetical protein
MRILITPDAGNTKAYSEETAIIQNWNRRQYEIVHKRIARALIK